MSASGRALPKRTGPAATMEFGEEAGCIWLVMSAFYRLRAKRANPGPNQAVAVWNRIAAPNASPGLTTSVPDRALAGDTRPGEPIRHISDIGHGHT